MEKKQTNIIMKPRTHLRLKMLAAMMGMSLGDFIEYMIETRLPMPSTELDMWLDEGIEKQEEEKKQCS